MRYQSILIGTLSMTATASRRLLESYWAFRCVMIHGDGAPEGGLRLILSNRHALFSYPESADESIGNGTPRHLDVRLAVAAQSSEFLLGRDPHQDTVRDDVQDAVDGMSAIIHRLFHQTTYSRRLNLALEQHPGCRGPSPFRGTAHPPCAGSKPSSVRVRSSTPSAD